jgi:hypothetical protein
VTDREPLFAVKCCFASAAKVRPAAHAV